MGLPSGSRRARRAGPVSQRRINKLREGKLGVKWADRAGFSTRYLSCARRVRQLRHRVQRRGSRVCSRATETGQSRETPTVHPTRSTPAMFLLPRRNTSQRPCRKSEGCGDHSSLSMRTLLTYAPPSPIVRFAAPLLADSPVATSRSVIASAPARVQFGHRRLTQRGGQRRLVQLRELAAAEQRLAGVLHRRCRGLTVHQIGQLAGQSTLGRPLVRALRRHLFEFGQFVRRQEGEPAQIADHVGIGGVDEVLVPGVRARHLRVEPEAAPAGRLTELLALRNR